MVTSFLIALHRSRQQARREWASEGKRARGQVGKWPRLGTNFRQETETLGALDKVDTH